MKTNYNKKGLYFSGIFILAILCVLLLLFYFNKNQDGLESDSEEIEDVESFNDDIYPEGIPKDSVFENRTILILQDSIPVKLANFPDHDFYKDHPNWISYWFDFVDDDTIPEFVVKYFTGGAHCCDDYSIFRKTADNTYQIIFNYMSGSGSLTIENRFLKLSFYEQTGYFFTCYACDIMEELPDSTFEPVITLKYNANNFTIVTGSDKLNKSIETNLKYLAKRPIPEIESPDMDDGTRKAFARHIIAWHFNNQSNLNVTRDFFTSFYKAEDSILVWNEIESNIHTIFGMEYSNTQYIEKIMKTMDSFKEE